MTGLFLLDRQGVADSTTLHINRAVCFDLFNTLVSVGQAPLQVGRFTADILGIDRQHWRDTCYGPLHNIWQTVDPLQTRLQLAYSIAPEIPVTQVREALGERQARFNYA